MILSVLISRLPMLVEGLDAQPVQLLPDSAITLGLLSLVSRFMFRGLVGSKQQLADEADAEAALISLVRSALTPIIREGDTSPGAAVRRIVASEIELHHRDAALSVDSIAEIVGLSRRQLYRYAGEGVAARLGRRHAQTAHDVVESNPMLDLKTVAKLSGFSDEGRLRDHFLKTYGLLPSAYRDLVRSENLT